MFTEFLVFGFIVLAAQTAGTTSDPSPPRQAGPHQQLIHLVGTDAPDALKQAEAAHAALLQLGPVPTAASYALALIYVRENRLDLSAKTLDALANQVKLAPPILRLRLYLALEREEKELALRLVVLLKDQVLGDEGSDPEKVQTAKLLGGVLGALPDDGGRLLPLPEVHATFQALESASNKNVVSAFRLAFSEAAKRRKELQAFQITYPDREAAQKALTAALAERSQAERSMQETKTKLTTTIQDNKEADGEAADQLRQLAKQSRDLEQEWRLETPGRPQQPTRPIEPRGPPKRPSGKDSKYDANDYKRDVEKYEKEMRSYRAALQRFNQEAATFPDRLRAWQEKDRQRREQLKADGKQVDDKIAATREADKARDKAVDGQRLEIKRQTMAMQDLELKLQLLRSVASGEAERDGWISRPSNHGLLSFAAERQRLMQARP